MRTSDEDEASMAQISGVRRGPLVKPAVLKVAVVAAENAPQAISHTTIGTSQTTIGAKHMIKRRLGDAEAMLLADNNVSGKNRPLGVAPEAGSRKGITGYKPHCGGVT